MQVVETLNQVKIMFGTASLVLLKLAGIFTANNITAFH